MTQTLAPVSVIIPCYRCAATIGRAVASVAAQTMLPAEVLLVDDGNTDGTAAILEQLQQKYAAGWIEIVTLSRNSGPAVARNAGWDKARQPYLAFLDADDAWHQEKVAIQFGWLRDHPEADLAGHLTVRMASGDEQRPEPLLQREVSAHPLHLTGMLFRNALPTRSVMLRRSLSLRFEAGRYYAEDYRLWLELLCKGHRLVLLQAELAYSFKADYGEGGLGSRLWAMEQGELAALRHARQLGCVGLGVYALAFLWSLIRYGRRFTLTALKAGAKSG